MLRRHPGILVVFCWAAMAAACLPPREAAAQSRACLRLQLRLAGLPTPDNALARRYDDAIMEQRRELVSARRHAAHIGCWTEDSFFAPRCRAAYDNIKEMERNLVSLEQKRSYLPGMRGGGDELEQERRTLTAELSANGCAPDRVTARLRELGREAPAPLPDSSDTETAPSEEPGTFFIPNEENIITIPGSSREDQEKRYRTVCVRTCDGYYFPMSPRSARDDFARDQQNCRSICPGTDVRTYYQDAGQSETDTLMSTAADEPYTSLPTAFLYRRSEAKRPAGCGCGSEAGGEEGQNYEIIAGKGSAAEEMTRSGTAAAAAPDKDDGETTAPVEPTVLPPPGERKVRVVGPAFLPDRSGAGDRPVPDRTAVP